jgi:phosphatidylglycerophosphate synthase
MTKVHLLPWLWAVCGIALLATLWSAASLSVAGFLAGTGYLVVSNLLVSLGMWRRAMPRLGPANAATATRSVLVGLVTSIAVSSITQPSPLPLLVGLTVVALLLDAVDGWLARRFSSESELGARFDMEVDAFLMLVLSAFDARLLGWWILSIGLMRYAFVLVGWLLPWMRAQLPLRYWRKVVTAVAGIALALAATGWNPLVGESALATALVLLVESFGRDCVWLFSRRTASRRERSVVSKTIEVRAPRRATVVKQEI